MEIKKYLLFSILVHQRNCIRHSKPLYYYNKKYHKGQFGATKEEFSIGQSPTDGFGYEFYI
jgi:hypothetical protein